MTELDPLPDELARLFAGERATPAGDAETRARVRSRLAGLVAALPAQAAAATGTAAALGAAGKIIAVVAITIGAGVAAVSVARSAPPAPAAPPAIELVATQETPAPALQLIVQSEQQQLPPAATEPPRPRVEDDPPAVRAARAVPAAPPSEARLLRRAWDALASGHAGETLELAREAARLHPGGVLREEREALQIQALARLGRVAEARAAAEEFIAEFPASVHRARVESAIRGEPSP